MVVDEGLWVEIAGAVAGGAVAGWESETRTAHSTSPHPSGQTKILLTRARIPAK